ncbi:pyridoxal phosphate-dependent aminotransferase [Clostridium chromiireducens]|uniref:Aminotransferase n=1 Tax=Clostridium chromiireducens TaxID=225345 RepID=A0A964W1C6_9CLOT|nr:pyridoxal phosphate-dependent aminotransferase [Clostridium chromiireducens]MVX62917.1 pyridoxal phosphate-dependent aminotransferase [Clostridium chromiireducens]
MISNRLKSLISNSTTIRAMFEEGKRLSKIHGEENVFDFSIGNPNVEPPENIKEVIIDILNEESPNFVHGYMHNSGYEDVRDTISTFLNKKYNLSLTGKNLVMTCGAAGGLNIIFESILNPGDEIITFSPYFGEYKNYVETFHGILTTVPTNTENFEPDLEALANAITSKTKAILINTPNNPTGAIYSKEVLRGLTHVLNAKEKELNTSIYLISDEPYREIVYDDVEVPCILKYYNNSFIAYSYSKSLSLPGERIGYVVTNSLMNDFDEMMAALNISNRVLGFVNAPSLFQRVIAKTIGSEVDVNIYKKNRDLLYNHLVSLGFTCFKPQGAFYLFPKSPIEDDKKFCEDAKQFNLLLVPGSTFGCPGHVRLAYCTSYEKIEKSLQAFDKLAALYNLK